MNVLFITLLDIRNSSDQNLYTDLMREFTRNGHAVYVISPTERKFKEKTHFIRSVSGEIESFNILKVKTGNIQKTNIIEKGISTLLLESQICGAIKKYLKDITFDLILYSTPPITLLKPIKYVKRRDNAKSYLMLKDIFPQNAVDIGLLNKSGIGGIAYRFFRRKEKKLYDISDKIGCMSQANIEYLLAHNSNVDEGKVALCPNCIEILNIKWESKDKDRIRNEYEIPNDKTVFIYGGNLGKPQGIPFLIDCLKAEKNNSDVYFVIVGDGTEYEKLESFISMGGVKNCKLIRRLSVEKYNQLISACDIGMIFLDYRFTIPNYPSRLLGYMQAGIPVLAVTDEVTDIKLFLNNNDVGMWCPSNSVSSFITCVNTIRKKIYSREHILDVLKSNYSVKVGYELIQEGIMQ